MENPEPLTPTVWRCCHLGLGQPGPLEEKVTRNQYKVVLRDHLHIMMKNFYPDGSGFFQDIILMVWATVFVVTRCQVSWASMLDNTLCRHNQKTN